MRKVTVITPNLFIIKIIEIISNLFASCRIANLYENKSDNFIEVLEFLNFFLFCLKQELGHY